MNGSTTDDAPLFEEIFWDFEGEKMNETQAPDVPIDAFNASIYYDETQLRTTHFNRWFGLLSILCSVFVIQSIARNPVVRQEVSSRIMIALSVCDILYSFFGAFLGPWPAPEGIAMGAVGNVQSCAAAAVFTSIGFHCSTYYVASLALCYLLIVRYRWNARRLKSAEPFFLLVPLLLYLPFCILSIAWEGGNFNGIHCGQQATYPVNCGDAIGIPCIRGGKLVEVFYSKWYERGWLYVVYPSLICGPIVIVSMVLLFWTVYQQERANDHYRPRGSFTAGQSRMYSRQVAVQGIRYIFAFLAVEVPWVVTAPLIGRIGDPRNLILSQAVLLPLQGFWNALVFLRPRYWPLIMTCWRSLLAKKSDSDIITTRQGESDTMPATSEFQGKKEEEEEEKEETEMEAERNV